MGEELLVQIVQQQQQKILSYDSTQNYIHKI